MKLPLTLASFNGGVRVESVGVDGRLIGGIVSSMRNGTTTEIVSHYFFTTVRNSDQRRAAEARTLNAVFSLAPPSPQPPLAHATASSPAGMRSGEDGSVAARHTASATSDECVSGPESSRMRASTLVTSSA